MFVVEVLVKSMILLILQLDFQNFGFLLAKVQTGVVAPRCLSSHVEFVSRFC